MHNGDNGIMRVWSCGQGGRFLVRRGDIREQVARIPFRYDLKVRQGDQQRLADTESGLPSASLKRVCFVMVIILSMAP